MERDQALRLRSARADFMSWYSCVFNASFPISDLNYRHLLNQGYVWATDAFIDNRLWALTSISDYESLNPYFLRREVASLFMLDRDGFTFIYLTADAFVRVRLKFSNEFAPFVTEEHVNAELKNLERILQSSHSQKFGLFYDLERDLGLDRNVVREKIKAHVWSYTGTSSWLVAGPREKVDRAMIRILRTPAEKWSELKNSAGRLLPHRLKISTWMAVDGLEDANLRVLTDQPALVVIKKTAYTDARPEIGEQRMSVAQSGNEFWVWSEPRFRSGGPEFALETIRENCARARNLDEANQLHIELPKKLVVQPIFKTEPAPSSDFQAWLVGATGANFPFHLPAKLILEKEGPIATWRSPECLSRFGKNKISMGCEIQRAMYPFEFLMEFVESNGYVHMTMKTGLFSLGYRAMAGATNSPVPILKQLSQDLGEIQTLVSRYYREKTAMSVLMDMQKIHVAIEDEANGVFMYGTSEHRMDHLAGVLAEAGKAHRRVRKKSAFAIRTDMPLAQERWIVTLNQKIADTASVEWTVLK